MPKVYVSTVIDAPVEQVWAILRDFGSIGRYHSFITDMEVQGPGDQVGTVRIARLSNGLVMRERLLTLSDREYRGSYSADSDMATWTNAVGNFRVRPITDRNATFIEWKTYWDELEPGSGPALAEFLTEHAYPDIFEGLKRMVAQP